jgi:hypothetical protein
MAATARLGHVKKLEDFTASNLSGRNGALCKAGRGGHGGGKSSVQNLWLQASTPVLRHWCLATYLASANEHGVHNASQCAAALALPVTNLQHGDQHGWAQHGVS